ncbi:nibrin isoform X1 [Petromyzon marinus]|uniref:nibrin isoform X1 n=1 Tax=Petromyzon marinus TaxID=7757 RepID=UPI003F719D6F
MWRLEPAETAQGSEHQLLVGERHVVGRKDCGILIGNDQSISRVHAVLTVSHAESSLARPSCRPALSVKDSSKYGTFVNGEKLTSGSERALCCGDLLKFGVFESKYRVAYSPLVVCSSCLDAESKHVLSSALLALGGHFVSQWTSDCTHLVMTSIKVTVKTICALITSIPIVQPVFFSTLVTAIRSRSPQPSHSSFWPLADEPGINPGDLDLTPRPERRLLFQGKTFQFLHAKQHKRLAVPIALAGGAALCLCSPGQRAEPRHGEAFCVVEPEAGCSQLSSQVLAQDARAWAAQVGVRLHTLGLRMITEAEVGLAVVYCSTHTYCNPSARLPDEVSCVNTNLAGAMLSQNLAGATLSQNLALEPSEGVAPDSTLYAADTQASLILARCHVMSASGSQSQRVDETLDKRSLIPTEATSMSRDPGRPEVRVGTTGATAAAVLRDDVEEAADGSSLSTKSQPRGPCDSTDSARKPAAHAKATITSYFQPSSRKRARHAGTDDEGSAVPPKVSRAAEQPPTLIWPESGDRTSRTCSLPTQPYPGGAAQHEYKDHTTCLCVDNGTRGEDSHQPAPPKTTAGTPRTPAGELGARGGNAEGVPAPSEQSHTQTTTKKKKGFEEFAMEEPTEEGETQEGAGGPSAKRRRYVDSPPVKQEPVVAGDPEDVTAPTALLLCEFRSLVLARPTASSHAGLPDTPTLLSGTLRRNFKTFRKAARGVTSTLPRVVIAFSDLYHHEEESDDHAWIEESQRTQEEVLADNLFG